ncbi:hypothetical protein [Streptomyces sp. NPDC055287]
MPENTVTASLAPMESEDIVSAVAYIRALQARGVDTARGHNRLDCPHFALRESEPPCLGLSFKELTNPFPSFGRFEASHHPWLITRR